MLETLKKNWFVVIVAIVFIFGIGYYIADTTKGVTTAKKVDGQDAIYTINNEAYTADELYETLSDSMGDSLLAMRFEQAIINQSVELSDDQITDAKLQAEELLTTYKANYGDYAETILDSFMQSIGFNDHTELPEYFEFMTRRNLVMEDYLENNWREHFEEYSENYSPRIASHILVSIEDLDNISQEEQDKMDAVEKALADGEDFAEVAKEYSDDGSAADGGSLGFVTSETSFVEPFLEAVLEQEAGEVSEWVETQYGYHIIKTDSTSYQDLIEYDEFVPDFSEKVPAINGQAIMSQASDLNIDFHGDTELEERIYGLIGLEDAQ